MTYLTFNQAKHLVERAGIGSELETIQQLIGKSRQTAITTIIQATNQHPLTPPRLLNPKKLQTLKKSYRKAGQRKKANLLYKKERALLRAWGINNLLESTSPLHEHMVWFWHNHFTSSVKKVRAVEWMLQQDLLIRKHALGNFTDLLYKLSFSPAMLIYLDGRSNKKGKPNENFARELLELFTLGEGHYTEQDIKEAARAFTGWKVNAKKGRVVFRQKHHDTGIKRFMGKEGHFTGEDILSILLDQSRTAEFICEKLWAEFISIDTPNPSTITSWAKTFRASHYDIPTLLNTLFNSEEFWHKQYQATLIKSPIDIVVGTLRTLDMEDDNLPVRQIYKQMMRMGQALYSPPNVKGWVGGKAWIDDVKLPLRQSFLQRLTRGFTGAKRPSNKPQEKRMMGATSNNMPLPELPTLSETQWSEWLLAIPPISNINRKKPQARLRAMLLDPSYQLK